jgi:hypothetical protein
MVEQRKHRSITKKAILTDQVWSILKMSTVITAATEDMIQQTGPKINVAKPALVYQYDSSAETRCINMTHLNI